MKISQIYIVTGKNNREYIYSDIKGIHVETIFEGSVKWAEIYNGVNISQLFEKDLTFDRDFSNNEMDDIERLFNYIVFQDNCLVTICTHVEKIKKSDEDNTCIGTKHRISKIMSSEIIRINYNQMDI